MHINSALRKSTLVKIRNTCINNSDLDGMSLASFCQSRAVMCKRCMRHGLNGETVMNTE